MSFSRKKFVKKLFKIFVAQNQRLKKSFKRFFERLADRVWIAVLGPTFVKKKYNYGKN